MKVSPEEKKRIDRLRYRLHHKIRGAGFQLKTKRKTILYDCQTELPENRYLKRLIQEFGYVIQMEIN